MVPCVVFVSLRVSCGNARPAIQARRASEWISFAGQTNLLAQRACNKHGEAAVKQDGARRTIAPSFIHTTCGGAAKAL